MPTIVRSLGTLLMASALAVTCRAQETKADTGAQQTPDIVVQSRLVVLDIVVTDKHGALRNDLTQADFSITEDGTPQTITHFEQPAAHQVPAGRKINSTADLERLAPQAPATIIVLDELNTSFEDMAYARFAVKKYLEGEPDALTAPTMLVAVSEKKLQVIVDYTQDRAALQAGLAKHLAHYPWNMKVGGGRMEQFAVSLGALEQVTEAAAGHPGHKNVLWIGHGFPGIDLTAQGLDQNSVGGITSGVQQALNMMRDARVTLYAIDPALMSSETGVRVTNDASGSQVGDIGSQDPFLSDVSFGKLAESSGGKLFSSRNDVDHEIARSAQYGASFYTITYRPSSASDASQRYRKIKVTLRDPSLHAGFRDGYYARDEITHESRAARSKYDLDAASENRMTYTGFHLLAVQRPNTPDQFVVGVPQMEISWSESGAMEEAHLKLVVSVFNPQGKLLQKKTEELTEHRPAESTARRDQPVRLEVQAPLAAGASRVRFILWDAASGKLGTTELHLPGTPADAPEKR
ncbi:VWA domain-containing protein [Granulicella cerasi]|uniref:VWA domain-containing protein n=1 Tax=Granulicella cerasi TaxID=741063 RepID=A0ABW1Z658_9BACT|nr:VWA domain-containing protein [Granulicella cerasi]